jgi:hypothetical protein
MAPKRTIDVAWLEGCQHDANAERQLVTSQNGIFIGPSDFSPLDHIMLIGLISSLEMEGTTGRSPG